MTNPAEEIYVIFNKKTGSRKKYPVVHAYLSEKMGLVSSPVKRKTTTRSLSTALSRQRRTENDYQFQ
nr:MAG TPA: hypothetical protein [Caudoviricetes sp.]